MSQKGMPEPIPEDIERALDAFVAEFAVWLAAYRPACRLTQVVPFSAESFTVCRYFCAAHAKTFVGGITAYLCASLVDFVFELPTDASHVTLPLVYARIADGMVTVRLRCFVTREEVPNGD